MCVSVAFHRKTEPAYRDGELGETGSTKSQRTYIASRKIGKIKTRSVLLVPS